MKKIKLLILAISTPLLFDSCDTVDFGDTNTNPNGPTAAVTSQFLTNAEVAVSSIVTDRRGTLYTQQLTEGQYPSLSRYAVSTSSYSGWYTGSLTDLNKIISLNEDEATKANAQTFGDNNNQIAVAKLLKGYIFQTLTDRWGGLPLTEAFQGIDNTKPKFDTQEEIYNYIFSEIEDALSRIDASKPGPKGDIILGGNMSRWKVFANSLKMTMAMRISQVNPALAKTKFEEAANSGSIINGNSENIVFTHGSDQNSDSYWYQNFIFEGREDYILSETLTESLRNKLDPRLFKYGQESRNGTVDNPKFPGGADKKYVGAPNGAVNGNVPDYCLPSAVVINDAALKVPIFSATQMKFYFAEAKTLGWNVPGGSTSELYEQGIEESMKYWGVASSDISSYIASHPYSSLNDIAYEKWVAYFMLQPQESWAEWRRLDFPILTPSKNGVESFIPLRDAYDSSIIDNNKENYDAIISQQGADLMSTRLWWDVK